MTAMRSRPERASWHNMLYRCYKPGNPRYARYGGRGIQVCRRWRFNFRAFIADMGPMPGPGYTLDRLDNDGDYEPANCRWATKADQAKNRSNTRRFEIDGQTRCLAEWARALRLSPTTIARRLRLGWPPRVAILTPTRFSIKKTTPLLDWAKLGATARP